MKLDCILIECVMCYTYAKGNTLRENTIPGPWEKLGKYKCLVPPPKKLFPSALVEGVGEESYDDRIRKTN